MQCGKCQGLMVTEWLADELDEAYVWRCLNCGSVLDSVIDRHRKQPPSPALSVPASAKTAG
ncbi:hypothetical protein [Candidatus Nitrospira bockiana]